MLVSALTTITGCSRPVSGTAGTGRPEHCCQATSSLSGTIQATTEQSRLSRPDCYQDFQADHSRPAWNRQQNLLSIIAGFTNAVLTRHHWKPAGGHLAATTCPDQGKVSALPWFWTFHHQQSRQNRAEQWIL